MLRVIGISLRLPSLTPQNWLIEERLSECSETMFTELSAKEETWYSQETNLCVVGLVWCKNHIDVKLIARPSSPLNVITIQNMGYFNAGLYSPGSNISLDEKKSYSHRKGKNFNNHQVLIFCSSRTLFIDWNLIIDRIKQSISCWKNKRITAKTFTATLFFALNLLLPHAYMLNQPKCRKARGSECLLQGILTMSICHLSRILKLGQTPKAGKANC